MPAKITILSTRPLENALLEAAKAKNIGIDIISFIDTTPVNTAGIQEEIGKIGKQTANVVFTSMNAVEAVANQLSGEMPAWDVYTIGHTTRELSGKYFGETALKGSGSNASALADAIVADRAIKQVVFFCGDQRREELPGKLRQHGVTVQEIIVYHTTSTPHRINQPYDGILFFSPSAVYSYFSANPVLPDTVWFAIGQTTADAIHNFADGKVVVSEKPGKDELVKKVFEYFKR